MTTRQPLIDGSADETELQGVKLTREEEEEAAVKYALETARDGLTSAEAATRLKEFGPNMLQEIEKNECLLFLSYFWGPMPIMIWIAMVIVSMENDWDDFTVLLTLQTVNGLIGYYEEKSSGDAIAALKQSLAPKATVKRDGAFVSLPARDLVPGDLVNIKLGDIVPADCRLGAGKPLEVDQAALTGESLPVQRAEGETVFMGSVIVRGEMEVSVVFTGGRTFFGRAAEMVNKASQDAVGGRVAQVMLQNVLVLSGISICCCIFIFFKVYSSGLDVLESLSTVVVILVASIPIGQQIVTTTVMAVGSRFLAEKGAIVARLSAIEELAGMDVLCSDKTGTLTLNKLKLYDPVIINPALKGKPDELTFFGALAAKRMSEGVDAIDRVIVNSVAEGDKERLTQYEELDFTPFDPVTKRTEAVVKGPDGVTMSVTKGATKVILGLCADKSSIEKEVMEANDSLANRGFRSLGVATKIEGKEWEFQGVLSLFDPPRHDTAETLSEARVQGIRVKMVTGDQTAIAIETSRTIKLAGDDESVQPRILDMARFTAAEAKSDAEAAALCEEVDGFAEVYPEHKFRIVELLQNVGHTVGMTGDGVNDAPALKKAQIGIAVEGATDAARAAADIVLTEPGLSTIIDAIMTARCIFARVRNYTIYRIACTLQLIFFFLLGCILYSPDDYYCASEKASDTVSESVFPTCDYSSVTEYGSACHDYEDYDCAYPYYYPSAKYAFCIPVLGLVIITILNDGCILTIARDHVVPAGKPQAWDLPQLRIIAVMCGIVPLISSLLMLGMAFNSADGLYPSYAKYFGLHVPDKYQNDANDRYYMPYEQMAMLMYLKISISDFLTLFAARTRGPFFERMPSMPLLSAFVFATITATVIALAFNITDPTFPMHKISPKAAAFVWVYNIFFFIIQDAVKVVLYKLFDKFDFMAVKEVGIFKNTKV